MAKYTFVRFRGGSDVHKVRSRLREVCDLLTPVDILGACDHVVDAWPGCPDTYVAVQNSPDRTPVADGRHLVIGWINEAGEGGDPHPASDGSYAVIRADEAGVSFYTDQFGSRTLWYYLDERMLVVSTSQRAVVRLKGHFTLNREALSWFLSSGCQGPFMSWDENVRQAEPRYEYVLDPSRWTLVQREKAGMSLPAPSSERFDRFIEFYEAYAADALAEVVAREEATGKLMLPLSGGLDSRLLLSLAHQRGIADRLDLVNWGVAPDGRTFDDKVAARRVADFYGMPLLDARLPETPRNHDRVLDRFVQAGDCRVDHFNAYTDAFAMWSAFYGAGYRTIVRGDIPFTEGIDVDGRSARAHIGLDAFADYDNLGDYELAGLPGLQRPFDIERERRESLIRWRDRLYVSWRVPMVIAAFADLVNGYVENRSPMMSWQLFSRYWSLPDGDKGDKKHIQALCEKRDRSGVPFNARPSILPIAVAFAGAEGQAYLETYLSERCDRTHFPTAMKASVLARMGRNGERRTGRGRVPRFVQSAASRLSEHMPATVKGYLKSRRPRRLPPMALAHRIILADKAIKMYEAAAA